MLIRLSTAGFTLLELLICISILAILAVLAVPSFRASLERNEIMTVAEALSADLRWSRGEALKRNVDIKVKFTPGAAGVWEYVITAQAATPVTLKTVKSSQSADFKTVALAENFGSDDIVFNHSRGTTETQAGAATLTSSHGTYKLNVVVGNLERVRICSALGDIGGYDT
ncbi:MAG: prepilin-type N-terminal cleavage/methylation domain-containing protein, partial [Methylococcaceae bacterium]|nr:prepilin-type N-terminal cleavage/methylation domain-containing protein [Methylococcaceae bacterium]